MKGAEGPEGRAAGQPSVSARVAISAQSLWKLGSRSAVSMLGSV